MKRSWSLHLGLVAPCNRTNALLDPAPRPRRGARSAAVAATLAAAASIAFAPQALAWGAPHAVITRAAAETLPTWQTKMWGDELARLISDHCFIPDRVHSDPEAARFAAMDSRPGVRYLVGLHLPATQPENYDVLQKAAVHSARLAADALHTVACLAMKRIPEDAAAAFRAVPLSQRIPLEAPTLAVPQSAFFSRPHWGYAQAGLALRGGTNAVPLALRIDEAAGPVVREFADGIGTGTRSTNSVLVPPGVYRSFESWVGLHAVLGTNGHVVFEVLGDGRSLARVGPLKGSAAAQRISAPVAGVTNLQMIVTSAGGDGLGN